MYTAVETGVMGSCGNIQTIQVNSWNDVSDGIAVSFLTSFSTMYGVQGGIKIAVYTGKCGDYGCVTTSFFEPLGLMMF